MPTVPAFTPIMLDASLTDMDLGYRGILNEWVYGRISRKLRAASESAAMMCVMQKKPVDMLMFYDAQITSAGGLIDPLSYRPLKEYYTFKAFNELYKLGTEVKSVTDGRAFMPAPRQTGRLCVNVG